MQRPEHSSVPKRAKQRAEALAQPIKYLQIFGERCSGTNFLESLVQKNFKDVALTKAFGGKHWFIQDHHPRCRANQSTDYQCRRPLADSRDTLFLCIVREPIDWLRSFHLRPYHAGDHWNLPFCEFIRKPWHSFETSRLNPYWPSRADGYWFIEDAENVLCLRTRKIQHILNLAPLVEHFYLVNYETLRDDVQSLAQIAKRFGIALAHRQIIGERRHLGRPGNQDYVPRHFPAIGATERSYISRELDWAVEGSIGYHRTLEAACRTSPTIDPVA